MAVSQIRPLGRELELSLARLCAIARRSYPEQIRHIAIKQWEWQLRADNPQWRYVAFKSFHDEREGQKAQVFAMYDARIPHAGIVGYFACTDADIGAAVLKKASVWLKKTYKIQDVYGPINGTLPNDYRLNTDDDYSFPGEPVNPSWHIDAFHKAGFEVFNRYGSARLKHYRTLLRFAFPAPRKQYRHMHIRSFSNSDFEKDFKTYHELRNQIFPYQSVYCPAISLEERKYNAPGKFDPSYAYFLVDDTREVGFIMAYPYKNQLVLKTIGLLPAYRGKRLANLLLKQVHDQAHKDRLTSVVYAMVREGNSVHRNKHPLAKVFRRYVTMRKVV